MHELCRNPWHHSDATLKVPLKSFECVKSPHLFQNRGRTICSFGNKYMKWHSTGRSEFLPETAECSAMDIHEKHLITMLKGSACSLSVSSASHNDQARSNIANVSMCVTSETCPIVFPSCLYQNDSAKSASVVNGHFIHSGPCPHQLSSRKYTPGAVSWPQCRSTITSYQYSSDTGRIKLLI